MAGADEFHGFERFEFDATAAGAWRRPVPGPVPEPLAGIALAVLGDFDYPTPLGLELGYLPLEGFDEGFVELTVTDPADGTMFGFGITVSASRANLTVQIAFGIQEHVSELRRTWGDARPPCPGDTHPADAVELDGEAWWVCPSIKTRIARVGSYATEVHEHSRTPRFDA